MRLWQYYRDRHALRSTEWHQLPNYASIEPTTEFGGDIDWKIWFVASPAEPPQDVQIRVVCRCFRVWLLIHYYLSVTGLGWGWEVEADALHVWVVIGGTGTRILFGTPAKAAQQLSLQYVHGERADIK